ncbi:MAG: hypothetical protein VX983_01615 [Actinomycetota bacterium]|nr:hypothetical protein [Acidimicrobiales bacterium]MED5540762.1 hypothetical protein [Actinomycetota bacterium]MEE2806314.1 hypothetical protein [Actinomycetota bacterium]
MRNRPIEPAWFIAVGVAVSWLGIFITSIPVIFTGFGMFIGFALSTVINVLNETRFGSPKTWGDDGAQADEDPGAR